SDADYIKTSTGFSTAGATREDIMLFKKHIKNGKLIKAAGGIRSLNDANDFISLGSSRLGTSSIVRIVKDEEITSY
ncbi:MAG TPA: 2-deoxyribose-5-phosphate aldolase, partial [Clostridia bacterium]|nr:2-deoxyribose-5-phosphate aldolase [Clostridia bacterium]